MKILKLFLGFILLTGCFAFQERSKESIALSNIYQSVSTRLNEKYHLLAISTGSTNDRGDSDADPENIKFTILSMYYNRYGPGSDNIDEAREMILDCAQEFLKKINDTPDFRPDMKVYPFKAKNISLAIFNYEKDGTPIRFPYISTISLSGGKISYNSYGDKIVLPFVREITETYEEALLRSKQAHPN